MRQFLLVCLLGLPLLSNAQPEVPAPQAGGNARVSMAQGKYVFCYAQPLAAYEVAFTFTTQLQPSERMTLNTVIGQCLTAALTEAGAQLKPFDAILIQPGQRDLAIKFRDAVPEPQRALATVSRNQGKLLYLFSEPLADYEVLKTEGVSWYNHAFGGAFYTLGHVQENALKTAKKNPAIEAIIIGETATYIHLKK